MSVVVAPRLWPPRFALQHAAELEWLEPLLDEVLELVEGGALTRAETLFQWYFHGLGRHLLIEEQLVFPLATSRVPALRDAVARLEVEHQDIRVLLELLRDAFAERDAGAIRSAERQLSSLLEAHGSREDSLVWPALDATLSEREREALIARIGHRH